MLDFSQRESAEEKRTDRILRYHYDHNLNNSDIAKLVDCSRENVRQTLQRNGAYSPNCWEKNKEE
jgi:DNA-binding transcriptional regulator LsrR (DeoR family)